jgi:hypothetical protein
LVYNLVTHGFSWHFVCLWQTWIIDVCNKLRLEVVVVCFGALALQAIRRGSKVALYLTRR